MKQPFPILLPLRNVLLRRSMLCAALCRRAAPGAHESA